MPKSQRKAATPKNSAPAYKKPASGVRQESEASIRAGRLRKKLAKHKGLKAGSRHGVEASSKKQRNRKGQQDPRLGSRNPIPLIVEEIEIVPMPKPQKVKPAKAAAPKAAVLTPADELERIENDPRLNDLLDRLDAGEELSEADAAWVDTQVTRHQALMVELGIVEDDDEDEDDLPVSDDELWERFNEAEFQPEPKIK